MAPTDLPSVISIDPPMSKDLDDAIGVARADDGGWTVDVCIPDVPAVVTPGSDEDRSARRKLLTRYSGSFVREGMLSEKTVAALSLSPRRTTPMCWFRIRLGADLSILSVEKSRIRHRTAARLSYLAADEALADRRSQWHAAIEPMWELAIALHARRRLRTGAIFDTERHIYMTDDGLVAQLRAKESHQTHLVVMEIMVLTNEALAADAASTGVPIVYRNHRPRDATSGLRAEVTQELRQIEGLTPEAAIERLRLLAGRLGQATFGTAPEGHWALDVAAYAWFTSPLRRYCDIVNLRALMHNVADPDLAATASAIDQGTRAIAEALSADHGLRARIGIARRVRDGHYANLEDLDLHTILRACAENEVVDDGIADEVRRRLSAGTVSGKDIESVFTYGRDVLGHEVIDEVLAWLSADRQRQLVLARDMVVRQRIVRIPSLPAGGPDLDGAMRRIGEVLEFAWAPTHSPVQADVAGAPAAATDVEDVEDVPHPNPKGALLELATARHATAEFEQTARVGPSHAPRFTVEARWTSSGRTLRATASASSVKIATRVAAWRLLQDVEASLPARATPAAPAMADSGKPAKNRLLEHAVATGGSATFGVPRVSGPPHQPLFEVVAEFRLAGSTIRGEGSGRSKKDAERAAAEDILARL